MTAATSTPTASRNAGHASRVVGASPAPPRLTRRRTRSARSSSAFASRHRAHARRWRSCWHASALHTRCRSPARACGRNHRRQTRQGRERTTPHRRAQRPLLRHARQITPGPILASTRGSFLASGEEKIVGSVHFSPVLVWDAARNTPVGFLLLGANGVRPPALTPDALRVVAEYLSETATPVSA
jgi:hypothetical protein